MTDNARKRKSPSSIPEDMQSVSLKVKGLEKDLSFYEKLEKYIEADNAEWLETLITDRIKSSLQEATVDYDSVSIISRVAQILRWFTDSIYGLPSRVYPGVKTENYLVKAIRGKYTNSVRILVKTLKVIIIDGHELSDEMNNIIKEALIEATKLDNVTMFEDIFTVVKDRAGIIKVFEYAYKSSDPQPEIIARFAQLYLDNGDLPGIDYLASHKKTLEALQMFTNELKLNAEEDFHQNRIGDFMKQVFTTAVATGPSAVIYHALKYFQDADEKTRASGTSLATAMIGSYQNIIKLCERRMYDVAQSLMPYTTTENRMVALRDFVARGNLDGVKFMLSLEPYFPLNFSFKFTDGKTVHQFALDRNPTQYPRILDALFRNRLCKNNRYDSAEEGCMADSVMLDCLDPNGDILINVNSYNGQGWECQGPQLYTYKEENKEDPFTRDPISIVRVNDLIKRLFKVHYNKGKVFENDNTITPESRAKALKKVEQSKFPELAAKWKNDLETVLAAVKNSAQNLQFASDDMQKDRSVVMQAVRKWGRALQYTDYTFRNDREIVLTAIRDEACNIRYASDDLTQDKEFGLISVSENPTILNFLHDELQNDKDIVLAALHSEKSVLAFHPRIKSPELLRDKEVVLTIIQKGWDPLILKDVGQTLQDDKEVVMAALKMNKYHSIFKYASDNLKDDKEVVLAAIENDSDALESASEKLKHDRDIVLKAVKRHGSTLSILGDEFKNDREIVVAAVNNWGHAIQYSSQELQNDRDLGLMAVQNNGHALSSMSEKLKNDKDIVMTAMKNYGNLEDASDALKNDKEVVMEAVKMSPFNLKFASDILRNDKEVVLTALKEAPNEEEDYLIIKYASEELKNDEEVALAAVERNGVALDYVGTRLKNQKNIVLAAVQEDAMALKYTTIEMKDDEEIVRAAISTQDHNYYDILGYASERLQKKIKEEEEVDGSDDSDSDV